MSVIKTCGGYDKAKIYVEQFKKLNLDGAAKLFDDELLEYRRANNIFEEGDSVLYKSIGDGHVHKYSKLTEFRYDLRHATDIEIAQGHRS